MQELDEEPASLSASSLSLVFLRFPTCLAFLTDRWSCCLLLFTPAFSTHSVLFDAFICLAKGLNFTVENPGAVFSCQTARYVLVRQSSVLWKSVCMIVGCSGSWQNKCHLCFNHLLMWRQSLLNAAACTRALPANHSSVLKIYACFLHRSVFASLCCPLTEFPVVLSYMRHNLRDGTENRTALAVIFWTWS